MCGAVQFDITGELRPVVNCHCFRCRQWSGHYWAATAVAADDLAITDAGTLTWFSPADGVEYGFCSRCGSSKRACRSFKPTLGESKIGTVTATSFRR